MTVSKCLLATAVLFCAFLMSAAPGGTEFHTTGSPSAIALPGGGTLQTAPGSTGTLFSDHVVLDSGALRIGHFDGFAVNVQELIIQAQSAGTQAVVRMDGGTVEVASIGGGVDVLDHGAMFTRIAAGSRMSFRQSGAAPAQRGRSSNKHVMLWIIGGTAVAALTIGLIAAAQGKSPF